MADYIDRQATIGAVHSAIYPYFCGAEDGDELSEDEKLVLSVNKAVCGEIKELPSADVQPVRHGHWMVLQHCIKNQSFDECKCSECGVVEYFNVGWKKFNYCPNCGARMDGERK